jgi:hypothetical protein
MTVLFHLDISLKVVEYMDFSHILHCKYFLILTKIKKSYYDYRCT